ncbi:uncharacterized protein SCHCODRAFT_02490195 [Schizophyllum commune H4-8]|nr:uncharacterized protein SCHCODRAFT_02490195 [Schizophyllum commune H4-8]KAI5897764.1 hypothetical protein SCHCODRAFT_02490195 [Schizophyllum commune H4-8]
MDPQVFELVRGYASLVPPSKLSFPNVSPLSTLMEAIVAHLLESDHFQQYAPSAQYQKTFWKWAIDHLERLVSQTEEEVELDDRIYDHYLSFIQQPSAAPDFAIACPRAPPSDSYITHYWCLSGNDKFSSDGLIHLENYQTVTLRESRTTIQDGTTGLRTWLASLVLSKYLINEPDLIANKRILELGSGIGFLGIICASVQLLNQITENAPAPHLWLTDVNDDVLARCKANVQLPCNLSSDHPNVHYRNLDWVEFDQSTSRTAALADMDVLDEDVILGADIVFDPSLIEPLVTVLALRLMKLRQNGRRMALIALTVRNPETFQAFVEAVERAALTIEYVDYTTSGKTFLETSESRQDGSSTVKILRISYKAG